MRENSAVDRPRLTGAGGPSEVARRGVVRQTLTFSGFGRRGPAWREPGSDLVQASSLPEGSRQALSDPRLVLVVSDRLTPGMTGAEFAREVQTVSPRMPILIISGYADLEDVAPDLPRLMKPFRESELAAAVSAALKSRTRADRAAQLASLSASPI